MGWDRPFRTSLDRRWTLTLCFGRRCEFDKVGLSSSASIVSGIVLQWWVMSNSMLLVDSWCSLFLAMQWHVVLSMMDEPRPASSAFVIPCNAMTCCFEHDSMCLVDRCVGIGLVHRLGLAVYNVVGSSLALDMLVVDSWSGIDRVPWFRFGVSNDVEA